MFGDVAFAAAPFSALGGNSYADSVLASVAANSDLSTFGTAFIAQTDTSITVASTQTLSYVASAQQSEFLVLTESYSPPGVFFAFADTRIAFTDVAAATASSGVAVLEALRSSSVVTTSGVATGDVYEYLAVSDVYAGAKRAIAFQSDSANVYVDSTAQYAATAAIQANASVSSAALSNTSTTASVSAQLAVNDSVLPVKILSQAVAEAVNTYAAFISGQVQPVDAAASFAVVDVVAVPTVIISRTVSETIALSQTTTCQLIAQATVSNTVSGAESTAPVMVALVRLEATVAASDINNGVGVFDVALSDATQVSSAVDRSVIVARGVTNTVTASDLATLVVLNPAFISTTLSASDLQSARAAFVTTVGAGLRVIDEIIGGQFTQTGVEEVIQVIADITRKSAWEPDNTDVAANWASSIESGGNANWGSSIDSGASANWGPINTLD